MKVHLMDHTKEKCRLAFRRRRLSRANIIPHGIWNKYGNDNSDDNIHCDDVPVAHVKEQQAPGENKEFTEPGKPDFGLGAECARACEIRGLEPHELGIEGTRPFCCQER